MKLTGDTVIGFSEDGECNRYLEDLPPEIFQQVMSDQKLRELMKRELETVNLEIIERHLDPTTTVSFSPLNILRIILVDILEESEKK